jgi:hypothetical protein
MEYLISENQLKFLINEIEYDPEVEKIQKILVKKYDLGDFGPKGDGVDGKAGPLTRKAYQKEFGKELTLKSKTPFKSPDKSSVKPTGSFDAVLVGGLDYRDGDLDIDSQVKLLNSGLGNDKKIKGFRYSTSTRDIEDFLEKNPKIPVYLFSAGCKKANELAVSPYVNKNKLFILIHCKVAAILRAPDSAWCWSRASTITRTKGSVPLARINTRPVCPNSASTFFVSSARRGLSCHF